jgi:hypothetical protein
MTKLQKKKQRGKWVIKMKLMILKRDKEEMKTVNRKNKNNKKKQ